MFWGFDRREGAIEWSGELLGVEQGAKEQAELSAAGVHCLVQHLAVQHVHVDMLSATCTRVVRLEADEKWQLMVALIRSQSGLRDFHNGFERVTFLTVDTMLQAFSCVLPCFAVYHHALCVSRHFVVPR